MKSPDVKQVINAILLLHIETIRPYEHAVKMQEMVLDAL